MADEKDPKVEDFKWPWEYTLYDAVPSAKGEDVKFLTLRRPSTEDMVKFGVLDGNFNGENVVGLISLLSEGELTPRALSRALHPRDFFALRKRLADFFTAAATGIEGT